MMKTANLTLTDVAEHLSAIWIEDDQIDKEVLKDSYKELNDYRISHAKRFLRSLQLIQKWAPVNRPLRILEIGAAPYFFTTLLMHYVDCEIVGGNIPAAVWPGVDSDTSHPRAVRMRHGADGHSVEFPVYVFNIEKDPFPFPDASFDFVLSMEVIEHLAYSPTNMLVETHRVLKPGGRLLLSTPNVLDLRRTLLLLLNRPYGFHYSGYGVYGRHNREYTLPELRGFVEACNYHILYTALENIFLRTHYRWLKRLPFALLNFVSGLPLPYFSAKREYMFLVAEPVGQAKWAYPPNLYIYPHLYPRYERIQ